MDWLYLTLASFGGALTAIAWFPPKRRFNLQGFLVGWLYGELELHHLALQMLTTLPFAAVGALDTPVGATGLVVSLASWTGLFVHWRASFATRGRIEPALLGAFGPGYAERIDPELQQRFRRGLDWGRIAWPFSPRSRRPVIRHKGISFARSDGADLALDVYTPAEQGSQRPVLLQIHGGAWSVGTKNEQALPLIYHMAERGWVCVSTSYRLSPKATFPDHLVDCKRALAWIRAHIAEYGGDPDFVVTTGGSAGGHLSALVALTPNAPEYQPDFESVDTQVQGCVPFYGVFDWTSRTPRPQHHALAQILTSSVMKKRIEDDTDAYRRASPMWNVHKDAPPFFALHGDSDCLVPVEDARDFVELMRKESLAPTGYLEVPRGQHAFDIFDSVRTQYAVNAVERFCAVIYSDHRATMRKGVADLGR